VGINEDVEMQRGRSWRWLTSAFTTIGNTGRKFAVEIWATYMIALGKFPLGSGTNRTRVQEW